MDGEKASLTVESPEILRNGELFEIGITVKAHQSIEKLVIGMTPSLWRNMTVNTIIPAASEETFEDGLFRFTFGKLDPGTEFRIKIDGQINPPLFAGTKGEVAIFDDNIALNRAPVSVRVLP